MGSSYVCMYTMAVERKHVNERSGVAERENKTLTLFEYMYGVISITFIISHKKAFIDEKCVVVFTFCRILSVCVCVW